MKKSFLYIGLIILCSGLWAQTDQSKPKISSDKKKGIKVDKLDNGYFVTNKNKDSQNTNEIYALINKANTIASDSPQKALDYIGDALDKSFRSSNLRGQAFCYNSLGGINYQLSRFDVSIGNYQKSIDLFRNINEEQGLYNSYKYMSSAYDARGIDEKALEAYAVFLEKAKFKGEDEDIISTLKNMARIYFNSGRYEAAKRHYFEVLEIEKKYNREERLIDVYNYLSRVYSALDMSDSALYYLDKGKSVAEKSGSKKSISKSLDNQSDYYRDKGQRSAELETRYQSLATKEEQEDLEGIQQTSLDIGKIYLETDQPEEAIPFLKTSIDLAEEMGGLTDKSEASKTLSEAYEKIGDYENAFLNLKNSREIDQNLTQEKFKAMEGLIALNEDLSIQDQRIAMLVKDKELMEERIRTMEIEQEVNQANLQRQRVINYALIFGIILILISGYFVWRSYQEKRKANLLLHLKSLRSQMNPHFIFNSLNSINSFIAKNDDRSANKYLADFSKLMRAVMENSQEDFVPLSQETKILGLYLGLEHFRFRDKFDYEFEVDPEIDQEEMDIPPMLIQPYIENSIWHGLRYREEKGFLKVSLNRDGEYLKVVVEDDGIGREKSLALKTKNQKAQKSTGLKNTAERLRIINMLYKKDLTVEIQDVMNGEECVGTLVEIRIPFEH